jgi:hypothetical protein
MAQSNTPAQNPIGRINNYMNGAAALHYAQKDDSNAAVRLMAHAYSRKDADGDVDVDTLGAIALNDVYRLGFDNSGIGNRAQEDYKKFSDGLEACTVTQINDSELVKGLDDAKLGKMVAKDGSTTWKDATKKFREYRLRQNQENVKYEEARLNAGEDKDKRQKADEEHEENSRKLNKDYEDTLRVINSISIAQESAFARLNANAALATEYSKRRLSPDVIRDMARN